MANKTVVRNAAYTRGSVSIRERHNERKNECYSNADIRLERSSMNIHFRQCEGTYTEAFDKLLEDGVISTRGLKADAKIIDESKLKTDSVQILNKVELKNVKNGMKMTYTIVSESEANLKEGKISVNTPIAQGLLGKKVGDVAEIKVPQGMIKLEVVSISF